MSVVAVATIVPLAEHREEVIAIFEETIRAVHAEEGWEVYALHEGEDQLVMIEKWTSAEALDAHMKRAALEKLGPAIDGKLTGPPEVQLLRPHPAVTTEQGSL